MYCRHCTRKIKVGDSDFIPEKDNIKNTPVIRDALLSGMCACVIKIKKVDNNKIIIILTGQFIKSRDNYES